MRQQLALAEAIKYWSYVSPVVKSPQNDKEFNELLLQLDELLKIVADDENHRLMGLVDALSHIISDYEARNFQAPEIKGVEALRFLMTTNNLSQSDLSEVASQGVLSEILSGKRALNIRQIKMLAKRFNVSAATFID